MRLIGQKKFLKYMILKNSYFENIKSNYSMKVKKEGGFYNINFIDSQLEISDINNILQDHLIKFNIQTEDETPKI